MRAFINCCRTCYQQPGLITLPALVCILFLCISLLPAHTTDFVEQTCPVCSHQFEVELEMSGTRFGTRLDYKPEGFLEAPPNLPVCPVCKLIIYDEILSETTRDSLARFLASNEYHKLVADGHSSYYLLAQTLRHTEEADGYASGIIYLKASWQVEADSLRNQAYLKASLHELGQLKPDAFTSDAENEYHTVQLLIGEILRRTYQFDAAGHHFRSLCDLPEYKEQPYRTICAYQLELIQQRDAAPKEMPEIAMTEADLLRTEPYQLLERSAGLSSFTDGFTISSLRVSDGWTSSVYFHADREWKGHFFPRDTLACSAMAELIFPVTVDDNVLVGLSPDQITSALTEICDALFVQNLIRGGTPSGIRLRAAGDRLHWNSEEVKQYIPVFEANGISTPPLREWMKVIIDLPGGEMISMSHPAGYDLYIIQSGLFKHQPWRESFQDMTGETQIEWWKLRQEYLACVNREGVLYLIEIEQP